MDERQLADAARKIEDDNPPQVVEAGQADSIDVFGKTMSPAQVLSHAKQRCRTCFGRGLNINTKRVCDCVVAELARRYGPKPKIEGTLAVEADAVGKVTDAEKTQAWIARKSSRLEARRDEVAAEIAKLEASEAAEIASYVDEIRDARDKAAEACELERSYRGGIDSFLALIERSKKDIEALRAAADGQHEISEMAATRANQAETLADQVRGKRARLLAALRAALDKLQRRLESHQARHSA